MKNISIWMLIMSFIILTGCNENTYSDDLKEEQKLIQVLT